MDEHDEDVCSDCGGTGEVSVMEPVYPGEPHMADIGRAPCPTCKPPRDDEPEPEEY